MDQVSSGKARVRDSERGSSQLRRRCSHLHLTGMPEMLKTTSMVIGAGLGLDVACVTDGRFSGGTHGFTVGHVVPVRDRRCLIKVLLH